MSGPDLSIVIPSWNGLALLRAHLPSVVREASGGEVVVSDDGSGDDTVAALSREFPSARVARRERNGGFTLAANDGVAAARGRIVVLLNNDMDVRPGALGRLAAALDSDPEVFAAVPSIVRTATGDEEARTRLRFRRGVVSAAIDGRPGEDPAYACGGAMAFRRAEFLALGGFDPLFGPFYWEDVDLSYRARKRGRRIAFVDEARVDHEHGRTIGSRFELRRVARVYERNRLIFTWKNLTDRPLWRRHLSLLIPKVAWDVAAHPAFVAGLRDALRLRRPVAERRRSERREAVVTDRELLTAGSERNAARP